MTGYFSKLADRSGLTKKHGGAYIHPALNTENGWNHRKKTDEVTYDSTEENTMKLMPSDERKTFSNSESTLEISHQHAALNTAEQAEDISQHKVNESNPGHHPSPITDTERHTNRRQITDLSETATIHQTRLDHESSIKGKALSSTVPITNGRSEQTQAALRAKATSPVTDSALSEIQRKSNAPAVRQSHTEAQASQTVNGQHKPAGGEQAVSQKNKGVSIPESRRPQSVAIEPTMSLLKAINNDKSFVSEQSHKDPLSAAYPFKAASTNSTNRDGVTNTNRNESSTDRPVEIRIGTLSFDIRQNATTVTELPKPNDRLETQKPHQAANKSRPQTQAHRLSRYYLRGY